MRAPRAVACSSLSMMSAHPPSLSTNPLRSASNGREAVSGSGFFVSAVICAKAATVSGIVAASEPPAITRSTVAVADQPHRLADRVVGRRARRDRAVVGAGEPEMHRDVAAGGVGHEHRHHERRHASRALLAQHVVLVEERLDAADAGGVDHGAAIGADLGLARVGPRELRRARSRTARTGRCGELPWRRGGRSPRSRRGSRPPRPAGRTCRRR